MPRAPNSVPRPHQAQAHPRTPTEPRSFRNRRTDLVGKYLNEGYHFQGYTSYCHSDKPNTGSFAVYGIRSFVAGWSEFSYTPQLDAFDSLTDTLIRRAEPQVSEFDRDNYKDLLNGKILCYGVERLGPSSYIAYWTEIRDVSWISPTGEHCFHCDFILRRHITRYDSAVEVPLGQIRVADLRSARFSNYLEVLPDPELEEELHSLPIREATGAADQPIPVYEDDYEGTTAV